MNTLPPAPPSISRPGLLRRPGFLALLLFAAIIRLSIIGTHFTHVDDVGVAGTLVAAYDPAHVEFLFYEKLQAATAHTGTPRARLLNSLTTSSAWKTAAPFAASLYRFVCIPAEWTYAPAQFVITALLVHPSKDYRTALVAGRLPSFLAGLAGLILTLLAFRFFSDDRPALSSMDLVACAVVACSLEHVIFSVHMSNYALGTAAAAALILLLHQSLKTADRPFRRALLHGVALAGLFLCQYQILPLALAFMATRFIWDLRADRLGLWRAIVAGGLTGMVFALVFIPIYLYRLSDTLTAHWNAGPAGEFAFSPPGAGLGTLAGYTLSFFAKNGAISFASLVSFLPENSSFFLPVAAVLNILALIGLAAYIRSPIRKECYFALFAALTALLWSVLILTGKMMLAPTRHNLVLLPLAALAIARGVAVLARRQSTPISAGVCLLSCIALSLSLPSFLSDRRDPVSERHLRALVSQHHVQAIVHSDMSHNLILMPSLRQIPVLDLAEASRDPGLTTRTLLLVSRADLFASGASGWNKAQDQEAARIIAQGRPVEASESFSTDAEFEFSRRTQNGPNQLHLVVLGPRAAEFPAESTRSRHESH